MVVVRKVLTGGAACRLRSADQQWDGRERRTSEPVDTQVARRGGVGTGCIGFGAKEENETAHAPVHARRVVVRESEIEGRLAIAVAAGVRQDGQLCSLAGGFRGGEKVGAVGVDGIV